MTEDDGCVIHYLVAYHYDPGTGQWIDYVILTTWAECPQTENPPPYGGEGGPSGTGTDTTPKNQCAEDCTNNIFHLSDGAQVTSELESFEVTPLNAFTKWQKPRWVCLKSLTWALFSEEVGQIQLVTPTANKWQWKFLEHRSITFSGISIGGTVTPDNGEGTPSFTAGTRNVLVAGMALTFNVKYSPICDCPLINLITQPYSIPYSANALFAAKPN